MGRGHQNSKYRRNDEFNSHDTAGKKCVEIVKTLHVKFFPLAFP